MISRHQSRKTSANMKLMMAELSYVWPTSIAPVSEASGVSEMCTSIHYFWCCGTVAAVAKTSTLYLLFKKKKVKICSEKGNVVVNIWFIKKGSYAPTLTGPVCVAFVCFLHARVGFLYACVSVQDRQDIHLSDYSPSPKIKWSSKY